MNWCLCITLHPLSPERALQPSPGQSAAPPWVGNHTIGDALMPPMMAGQTHWLKMPTW